MHAQYRSSDAAQRPQLSSNPPSHAYRPNNQKNISSPTYQNNSQNTSTQKLLHNNVYNSAIEPQGRELLVMTIDLGNGGKDLLRIFEGEDPYQLARAFCEKHKLDSKLIEPLAQNIYSNMEQVLQESVETLSMCGPNSQRGTITRDTDPNDEYQGTGKFANHEEYSREGPISHRFANSTGIKGDNNSQRFHSEEQGLPETNGSPRYIDEEGMYEMLDHAGDQDAPILAERVGMLGSGNLDSPNKSSPKSQGARIAGGYRPLGYPPQKSGQQTEERQVKSAMLANDYAGKERNSKNAYNQNVRRSSGSVEEFYPDEDEQHGDDQGERDQQSANKNQGRFSNNVSKPGNIQTSGFKQDQSLNKSTSSTLHNYSTDINYGTLLYHRGLQKNEETKRQIQEKRKEKLELNHKECTFKPELNNLSKQIVSAKARAGAVNIEEMLIQTGKNTQEKLERVRSAHKIKEMNECTFHPEINIISHKIDMQKSQMTINVDQDRCVRLFQEAKARKDQKEYVANTLPAEYTFKPNTIDYKEGSVSQTTFEERDRKFKDRIERVNYLRQLKEESEVRDAETGEMLFKPKTGRAPAGRNAGNLPIGEYLYSQQQKIAESKRLMNVHHQKSVESSMMVRSNEKSQAMVENLLKRKLEEIFGRLDSDGDGLISSAKIDITQVDIDILETLAPILCEMEERNQVLNFETFFEQTERLFKYLAPSEKDQILLGKKKGVAEPQYSFQPAIDRKSEKLAQKKHPYGTNNINSLYASYTNEKKKFDEKINEAKSKKAQEELKECTFKPKMITKGTSGTRSAKNASSFNSNYFMDDLLL